MIQAVNNNINLGLIDALIFIVLSPIMFLIQLMLVLTFIKYKETRTRP